MDKEEKDYTEFLQKFYDHGLLREVYRSEKAIVCNIYNQFYAVIVRRLMGEEYKENIPIFIMNTYGLQRIIMDDNFAEEYYILLSEESQKKVLRFLDERLFQSLKRRNDVLRQKPTPENMDLEFEAELLAKGPDVIRAQLLEEDTNRHRTQKAEDRSHKRGLFSFFKRK